MSDTVTPHNQRTPSTDSSSAQPEELNVVGPNSADQQAIFDALFAKVMDPFGEACEREGVQLAFGIAIHPNCPRPFIFLRGHQFDTISLVAKVIKGLQRELIAELSGNVNDA